MLLEKSVKWSPLIQVAVLGFGTLTSFLVAYSGGNVNQYLPFVSETGAYSPEKCIFSLFLILGSLVGIFIVGVRYLLISQQGADRAFTYINVASGIIGISSMLGLAGVAAFPMTTVFWAHLLAAGVYFLGTALYFVCSTVLTFKIEGRSKKFLFRCALSVAILMLLFLLIICFPISLSRWHKYNSIIPALKEPSNTGFGMVLFCSILEWSVVAIILAFTLSFMSEMKSHGLLLTVAPVKSEGVPVVQDGPKDPTPAPSLDEMT